MMAARSRLCWGTLVLVSTEILILVVDDEPLITSTLEHALEDAGYAITAATNGDDAMRLLESKSHDFRALITDVNLGGKITGWDIAHRARELNPTLPVVYMTGGAAAEWRANGVPESILVNKRFALAQVVTAVAQLMNAAASALLHPGSSKP